MDVLKDALHSMYTYITGAELWIWLAKTILRILVIIVLAYVAKIVGNKLINTVFKERKHLPIQLTTTRREQTLKNLLKNILSYLVTFIAVVMILDIFDVPIGTLLAGAGVVGLAIGFGAQSLVKDVIAGFFIIFEDQFSVGDYIEMGDIEGDVEVIGLRTTKVRSFYGQQFVLPNGSIEIVTNYSVHNGFSMVDVNLPYETDIVRTEAIVEEILQTLPDKYDMFIETPYIHGVQALDLSNYILQIRAETTPVMQWAGARAIRKEMKEGLFERGINIPSPRMVVYAKHNDENVT